MPESLPDVALLWGFGIGTAVTLLLMLRWPAFRTKVLGLKVFGRSVIKAAAIALLFSACTAANGSERPTSPGFHDPVSVAIGPNVAVVITWRPGTTDSITFTATTGGVQVASMGGVAPFAGVDTLLLGARPAPGVTAAWDVAADYWWTDRGTATNGTAALGTVQYTEPQPAGTPPGFDPLPPADTTVGSGPQVGVIEMEVWPNVVTVAADSTVQFCALARLTDNPALWVALPSITAPAPALCVAAAGSRNSPSGGGSVG